MRRAAHVGRPPTAQRLAIRSSILGEERELWIAPPASLGDGEFGERDYLPVYLLDAEVHFPLVRQVVHSMNGEAYHGWTAPELLLVGVVNTRRVRDLTFTRRVTNYAGAIEAGNAESGGAEAFLEFLASEAIPRVEGRYRMLPYRTLVGHSHGGQFALHAQLARRGLFHAVLASDPSLWWDVPSLIGRLDSEPPAANDPPVAAYIAEAGDRSTLAGDRAQFSAAIGVAIAAITAAAGRHLLRHRIFADDSHTSILLPGFHAGIDHLLGFRRHLPACPTLASTIAAFDAQSKSFGVTVTPPPELLSHLAHLARLQGADEEAGELLRRNLANFPMSPRARAELAAMRPASPSAAGEPSR